jgi:hypothetical protein
MRTESHPQEDSPATLAMPESAPRSLWSVIEVEALSGFRLRVAFADGLAGVVDMSALVHSADAGVFAALRDPSLFAQVSLDYGAVSWPGELDLAPDAMHAAIQDRGEWRL